ncbi:MAG: hypothetical protein ABI680_05480 [Chthoniobacteraceae bacterium]
MKGLFLTLTLSLTVAGFGADSELPVVGKPHSIGRVETGLALPEAATGIEPSDKLKDFHWTFMTFTGGRFALWLDDTLIYHNDIAQPGWIPHNRTFESAIPKSGRHKLLVRNTITGAEATCAFDTPKTREVIIYSIPNKPLEIRAFHFHVPLM